METARIVFIGLLVLLAIIVLSEALKTRSPTKSLLISGLLGLVCLFGLSLGAVFTGIPMQINPYSVAISVVLGLPGVILMLIFKIL